MGENETQRKLTVQPLAGLLSLSRIQQAVFSIADQGFSVGGMFLVNVALARTQSKEEYGVFALSYSVFTFLAGLHNAIILEPYTVYGSGRYRDRFSSYVGLLCRSNFLLAFAATAVLLLAWGILTRALPAVPVRSVLGMALSCGVLLTALFVRRTFYLRRRPDLAARFSVMFFLACLMQLWAFVHAGRLDGFYAFAIAGVSWCIAAVFVARELPVGLEAKAFLNLEPTYWRQHWNYSRWVVVTALVFQLTTQGYYWLSGGLLSVKEVGNLKSMLNLVVPIDQVFTAMNLLILPAMCEGFATNRVVGVLRIWRVYGASWFGVTCAFAGLVNLFGKPLMHLLYNGRFDDIAALLRVLAFLPVVMGVGHTINGALKAAEKPNLVFYAYAFSGAVTFLVGWPLVVRLGLAGAVYGLLLSGAAYTLALAIGLWAVAKWKIHQAVSVSSAE
jgi:O-antigen/teichoic acid export membrane protein